jgi:ABC-2 type transport system permease protein
VRAAGLVLRQAGYDARALVRNPPAFFFSLALPVIFLLILASVFGDETLETRGNIEASTYYVPTLITLGLVSTTFSYLAINLVAARENRVLKRLRTTPLPPGAFIAGRVATAVGFAVVLTLVLVLVGWGLYGVSPPDSTIPGVVVSLLVGAGMFSILGIALSSFIPNEDSAPAMVNLVVLPLYFISGVFFPTDEAPAWLRTPGDVFPIKHLTEALLTAFDPRTSGAGIDWANLAVIAGWGAAGLALALATFRWTPRGE